MNELNDITLALSKGENFGWGVCSKYLKHEVGKIHEQTKIWEFTEHESQNFKKVPGKVFHALTGVDFQPISKIWGDENYGYTFFENELNINSLKNAGKFTKVIGGSSWNLEKLKEIGIDNSDYLIQGIDPEIFYPIEERKTDELFVIFSGGKFELRKGQDLVLKAVKTLQQKYPNIILINAWFNMWPQSMELFHYAPNFIFEASGNSWQEIMKNLYKINGLNEEKIITLDIVQNSVLRNIYKTTDIGIFPNRCEGGTNLVLMEYMACGKPVIGAYNSGQKDVLNSENSILIKDHKPFKLYSDNKTLWADWSEPDLDEIISQLEFAYHNREEIRKIGKNAGEFMKNYTWQKSAENLLKIINHN
jgi:glycosyltransferase involved in cell wall biosynthesis